MTAAAIRDKVAVKVKTALATVTATGQVFANGTTQAGIGPIPEVLVDATVNVLVQRGSTERTLGTGNQHYARTFVCESKFPAFDRGEAERFIDLLDDAILLEFSHGITLGGSVIECVFAGSDQPIPDVSPLGDIKWWSWLFRLQTRERFPEEMSA